MKIKKIFQSKIFIKRTDIFRKLGNVLTSILYRYIYFYNITFYATLYTTTTWGYTATKMNLLPFQLKIRIKVTVFKIKLFKFYFLFHPISNNKKKYDSLKYDRVRSINVRKYVSILNKGVYFFCPIYIFWICINWIR